ncbi:fumarylacetoacetate hydrolase family protein [Salinirubellus sp. GCM10025818]|uniref:fumarylacetoacetate hydrolase family protein n=1 Tax=Salinirubellus TaxID=2162630 RepID=UPI0030D1F590
MSARYLARSADGRALLGDDEGYVPLDTADPSLRSVDDALRAAPDGLPDPDGATASRRLAEHLGFASPIERPGKLFGIGLNYADHATDLDEVRPDEPASFFKPATAATGPGGPIRLPPAEISDRVTAEAELAVVIGRTCRDVPEERVDEVVAGYVPVIDMTAEDILERNPRFLTRSKSFDTFLVFGPRIVVPDDDLAIGNLDDVEVRTVVDDEVIAENTVSNMLFRPHELVSFHSSVMTLEPGDVISTGTPGAGVIRPGDSVRAEVDSVGTVHADVVR